MYYVHGYFCRCIASSHVLVPVYVCTDVREDLYAARERKGGRERGRDRTTRVARERGRERESLHAHARAHERERYKKRK